MHLKETESNWRPTLWQRSIILKPFPSVFTQVYGQHPPCLPLLLFLAPPSLRYHWPDTYTVDRSPWSQTRHSPSAVCVCIERQGGITQVFVCPLVHVLILDICVCLHPVWLCCVFIYLRLASALGFGEISKILSSTERLFFHQFKWNNLFFNVFVHKLSASVLLTRNQTTFCGWFVSKLNCKMLISLVKFHIIEEDCWMIRDRKPSKHVLLEAGKQVYGISFLDCKAANI